MEITEAWVLKPKNIEKPLKLSDEVELTKIQLPHLGDSDVLIEPLYGSWEANMTHAIERRPIDIVAQRKEPYIVLGNAGVVRVLKTGKDAGRVKSGDVCLFYAGAVLDEYGYPILIHAYDAPNTIGLMAKRTIVPCHSLFRLPENSKFSCEQWSSFSIKYLTAWSNFHVALGAFRLQVSSTDLPVPQVWGWGGGTTLAELCLAQNFGCTSTLISGNTDRMNDVREYGIGVFDRRELGKLDYDPKEFLSNDKARSDYLTAEKMFSEKVMASTEGQGISIFVDYIGRPVFRASLGVLSRQGVITTAGWKCGMDLTTVRGIECIKRHIHVHTHYSRLNEVQPAIDYAEQNAWVPKTWHKYKWEDIPRLIEDYNAGEVPSYFPIYEVNGH